MCNYFDSTYYTMAYANFVLIQGNSDKVQQCQKTPVNASKIQ